MSALANTVHERFAQLLALKHLSQSAAWLEAIGPQRAAKTSIPAVAAHANRVAKKRNVVARIEEIQAQNEQECRWNRRQLLDFYIDILERGAGSLKPDDRLCQGVERTTVEHHDSKGRLIRVVSTQRMIMPSKVEAAEGVRRMCGWDKKVDALPEDDLSELLILIRKRSGGPAPQQAIASEVLTDHLQPLPQLPPSA